MEQDHHPDDDHVDKARPVSGEIMSAGVARETRSRTAADVSDAQYETVPATRSDAPARFGDAGKAAAGMDFLKSGVARNGGTRRGGVFFWLCGILLVGLAFWFSGGHALIAGNGQTGVASGSPLRIADVKSRVENRDGRSVLFVDGRAENRGGQALRLPPIEIAVTANEGGVTRYELATRDTELKPGDRYSFSSRLEAPASGVKTVSVAFQEGER